MFVHGAAPRGLGRLGGGAEGSGHATWYLVKLAGAEAEQYISGYLHIYLCFLFVS